MTISSPHVSMLDAEAARRALLVTRFSYGLGAIAGLYVVLSLIFGRANAAILQLELLSGVFFFLLGLARSKIRYAPEFLVGGTMLHTVIISTTAGGVVGIGPVILFVVFAVAGMVLRPVANLIFGAIGIASLLLLAALSNAGMVTLLKGSSPPTPGLIIDYTIVYVLLIATVNAIAFVNARSQEQAMQQMAEQADAAATQNKQLTSQQLMLAQQAAELAQQREMLELQVQKRTAELQAALHEVQQNAITLRELQAPLVPIAAGVLVMPVIGAFDRARATRFVGDLLVGIESQRAHTVLLDVTGLSVLDTLAAQTLIEAAQAARLLGASVVLVGVAPAVAQTIVGLGVDLRSLKIERDLQSAIEAVFWRVNHTRPTSPNLN